MSTETRKLRTYTITYLALMALLALTYGLQFRDLGRYNFAAAMGIAAVKAALVLLFFMHLRFGEKLNKIFAMVGGFWLLILFVLGLADFFTRG